jgi:hypothetical protein
MTKNALNDPPRTPDPAEAGRLDAILNSPSYRAAEQDPDFLASPETRGLRLQMEYLKAELLLEKHGVTDAIVVFGSTRIAEPARASKRLEAAERLAAHDPGDDAARREVEVARRLAERSRYYETAREFGALVGSSCDCGAGRRLAIVTGGGPGIMEAANRGAFDAGAETAGLNITLPREQAPNPYLTPELALRFRYFALRKMHFLLRARALVAFPGGYGTFDELFETLTLVQTKKIEPLPVILVGEAFWRRAVDFDFLVAEGMIDLADHALFRFAETAPQIWDEILRWRRGLGDALFCIPAPAG